MGQVTRLQVHTVVSNFGDGDCGAGKTHTHVREISSLACVFRLPHNHHRQIRDYSQSNRSQGPNVSPCGKNGQFT